jgi:hypothetical protein
VFWGLENAITTTKTIFFKPKHFLGGGVKDSNSFEKQCMGVEKTCACALAGAQHH